MYCAFGACGCVFVGGTSTFSLKLSFVNVVTWCFGCVAVGEGGEFLGDVELGDIEFGDVRCGDEDCFNVGDIFCGDTDGWYDGCLDGGGGGGGEYFGGEFCGTFRVVTIGTFTSDVPDEPCVIVVVWSGSNCTDGTEGLASSLGGIIVCEL